MASRRAFVLLAIVSSFCGVRCNNSNISASVELTSSAGGVATSGSLQPSPTQSVSQASGLQKNHNTTVTQQVKPYAASSVSTTSSEHPTTAKSFVSTTSSEHPTTAKSSVSTTSSEHPTTASSSITTTGSPTPAPCRMTANITFTLCEAKWKAEYIVNLTKNLVFPVSRYDVISVEIQHLGNDDGKTRVTVTITFGPPRPHEILFEKRLQEFSENMTSPMCMKNIDVKVKDEAIGKWEANDEDCKMKCCEGSGGPFLFDRKCQSVKGNATSCDVCDRVLKEKVKSAPCTVHCECDSQDSGSSVTASFFLVLAAVIMASA